MFWNFWRWKTWYFWAKKLMKIWYLLITEKFLFWSFRKWEIRSFFVPKSGWKDCIYWLLKRSCIELFGDGKYGHFLSQEVDRKMIFTVYWEVLALNFSVMGNAGIFFSQKVDGEMIFTWSFWAFHDIPGLGKYGFSRSAKTADIQKLHFGKAQVNPWYYYSRI